MRIPDHFQRQLRDEHGGRLRARWSPTRQRILIEQKVGHGAALPPFPTDARTHDRYVQAADGYAPVCEITPGDRTPCPQCGATLRVPHLRFTEIPCPRCSLRGEDMSVTAGYFPLGEPLLQHLRRIRPESEAAQRAAAEADAANQRLIATRERDFETHSEGVLADTRRYVDQVPHVGYGVTPLHRNKALEHSRDAHHG